MNIVIPPQNSQGKNQSSELIESIMKGIFQQQVYYQKNGNFKEAEQCRVKYEEQRRNLDNRRMHEMESRHIKQNSDVQKAHEDELSHFNSFWDKKMHEFQSEGNRLLSQMKDRHYNQILKTKADMQKRLTIDVKQSSELLNLRKMMDYMAKQKNYVQAQKVQMKVNKMQQQEKANWIIARSQKIQTAISTLKIKQENQTNTMKKRISAGLDEQNRDRHVEETRLKQKYENVCKQLKSQHQKEVLLFKGEFKSKGGSILSEGTASSWSNSSRNRSDLKQLQREESQKEKPTEKEDQQKGQ